MFHRNLIYKIIFALFRISVGNRFKRLRFIYRCAPCCKEEGISRSGPGKHIRLFAFIQTKSILFQAALIKAEAYYNKYSSEPQSRSASSQSYRSPFQLVTGYINNSVINIENMIKELSTYLKIVLF